MSQRIQTAAAILVLDSLLLHSLLIGTVEFVHFLLFIAPWLYRRMMLRELLVYRTHPFCYGYTHLLWSGNTLFHLKRGITCQIQSQIVKIYFLTCSLIRFVNKTKQTKKQKRQIMHLAYSRQQNYSNI